MIRFIVISVLIGLGCLSVSFAEKSQNIKSEMCFYYDIFIPEPPASGAGSQIPPVNIVDYRSLNDNISIERRDNEHKEIIIYDKKCKNAQFYVTYQSADDKHPGICEVYIQDGPWYSPDDVKVSVRGDSVFNENCKRLALAGVEPVRMSLDSVNELVYKIKFRYV